MKNKKLEKFFVKAGFGALFTFALGIVYKQGEKVNEIVDDKYEREHDVPKKNTIFSK